MSNNYTIDYFYKNKKNENILKTPVQSFKFRNNTSDILNFSHDFNTNFDKYSMFNLKILL